MEMKRCPLCGFEFDASKAMCTPACPLSTGCVFVCCPNCGYRDVDPTRAASVRWVRKWWKRNVEPAGKTRQT